MTPNQSAEMEHVSRSLNGDADLYEEEHLPAYSREPTEDGYAYEQQAELETKKGVQVEINEPHPSESPILPTTREPGYASESTLRRGLQVPTKSRLITSGFAYPEILAQCDINEEQWSNFTAQITKEAQMTPNQWTTTVGKGFGTFVVGGIFFGWLGIIPAAFVGHRVRANNEQKNLSAARSTHVLQEILNRWNEAVFRPKGLAIRVDLPGEAADIDTMDISMGKCGKKWDKWQSTQSESKNPRAQMRAAKWDMRARMRAAKKGRIVILPVGEEASRLAATMPTRGMSPVRQEAPTPPYEPSPVERTEMVDAYPDEKRGQVGPY